MPHSVTPALGIQEAHKRKWNARVKGVVSAYVWRREWYGGALSGEEVLKSEVFFVIVQKPLLNDVIPEYIKPILFF